SQFRLMVSGNRDTGRVNLCKTWITKECTLFMCFPGSSNITTHRIGRKVEYVTISTGADKYCMAEVALQLTGNQVAGYNTACFTVYFYHFQHLMTGIHGHITQCYLTL